MPLFSLLLAMGLSASAPEARDESTIPKQAAAQESPDEKPPASVRRGWKKKKANEDTSDVRPGEIWFLETLWTDGFREYEPRVGPAGAPLDWPDFYRRVDRPDYADSYESRTLAKDLLFWGNWIVSPLGTVAAAGLLGTGALFWFVGFSVGSVPLFPIVLIAGAIVLVATVISNVAFLSIPSLFSDWPVSLEENFKLAGEYNEQLLERPEPPLTARLAGPQRTPRAVQAF